MDTIAPGAALRDANPGGPGLAASLPHDAFAHEISDGGFDLRQLIALVRSNALIIAAIILGAIAIAVILTLLETPRYTATASVQINEQTDRVLGEDQPLQEATNVWDTDRFLQTQIDVLQSRGLAERVARNLKLDGNADFYRAMEVTPPAPGAPPESVRGLSAGLLQGGMSTELPRNSRVVEISFESAEPELSARVANAYVREFIAANLQRKFDSSAYARSFVADQLAEAKARLEASEQALNGYARSVGLIRTRDALAGDETKTQSGGSVTTASLIQLNQAANQARADRIAAEGRWRAVSGSSALNSAEVLSNSSVQNLLTRRAEVRAKLQLERAKHLEEHPSVIQLRAEAAEVDRQLASLTSSLRSAVRSQYEAARATEAQLAQQVRSLEGKTLAEQDRSVQYNLLAREADTNRALYDGLLQRYKELNAAAGISASNISVIDEAQAPGGPSSPNLPVNVLIALALGTMLAGAFVLFRDQFDDAIRVPEDVEHKLRLPLLGVVPKTDEEIEQALVDPKSPISEAYNSLGGSLLYSTVEGLPKVMLVTSAQPSEGKSTTSFAIAAGFARIGKRVVLIDADLRRPSLHHRAGSDNEAGLVTLLTSHEPIESVLLKSSQKNLWMIPSGPVPPSPTELIASNRMQSLIDELADKFDVVVVDSPPILGLADAPLMSALVDGVIMVVEADRSRRGTMKASLRRLRAMRPNLLGAVLTKFDPRKVANRYSDYYGYDYYQYKGGEGKAQKRLAIGR